MSECENEWSRRISRRRPQPDLPKLIDGQPVDGRCPYECGHILEILRLRFSYVLRKKNYAQDDNDGISSESRGVLYFLAQNHLHRRNCNGAADCGGEGVGVVIEVVDVCEFYVGFDAVFVNFVALRREEICRSVANCPTK